jgi:ABC-type branched-subunit amino acid transport system substrate-binding protein
MVNTEGTPGLDFPDIRKFAQGSADYLNQHGGFAGRPVKIETCVAKGSPETSQACAQELAGKKVQFVLLGLDLFPDYKTYKAASIPVIGVLPILPGDYTAEALFLTGGNATSTAAMAVVATDPKFKGAKTVGIVASDNPGANATTASLEAALKVAGVTPTIVKGGDNETDAGYQGLMREVAKNNPDVIISLYSDAGCIGTMRGRAALGIKTPVITTSICASKDVIDAVGDDALGWSFAGIQTDVETPEAKVLRKVGAPILNVPEDKVSATSTGLGGLGFLGMMSLGQYAAKAAEGGKPLTGATLYEYLKATKGLKLYGGQTEIECGGSPKYPSICSFTFPFAEYTKGGKVLTIKGGEAVSSIALLP